VTEQTPLDHATQRWHETNAAVGEASGSGNPPDPYRYAALLDARAGWWDHLGRLADRATETSPGTVRDVYAIACSYAAELDRIAAAEVRFRHRIPTLHPGSDATRLGLLGDLRTGRACRRCLRPWQVDGDGSCMHCPGPRYGITPRSAEEAKTYPPGQPWTPGPDRSEEYDGE
jgi:hypothetical protein